MPAMSRVQSALCRSGLWRRFARGVVLPWSLQGFEPHGDVLEIGGGSGAMAAELLTRYDGAVMTVTDVDQEMVDAASGRLARFGDRATVRRADATALPFGDGSFDVVVSSLMLHHTVEWEKALAEATRVLRPGGHLVGLDLLTTRPLRLVRRRHHHEHQVHGRPEAQLRMMSLPELRAVASGLPVDQVNLTPSPGGLVVRFLMRRR